MVWLGFEIYLPRKLCFVVTILSEVVIMLAEVSHQATQKREIKWIHLAEY